MKISKKQHLELVQGIVTSGMSQMRYCMKNEIVTNIGNLVGGIFKCWECQFHVVNSDGEQGICDPI